MINNSSLRISKGVRSNDALKSDDDKSGSKLDKEKSKTSSNQYHGYKNVRYSSYGNKLTIENRQRDRDDHKMARGSYTRKTTRGASKREYESYGTRRKFSEASKGLWRILLWAFVIVTLTYYCCSQISVALRILEYRKHWDEWSGKKTRIRFHRCVPNCR